MKLSGILKNIVMAAFMAAFFASGCAFAYDIQAVKLYNQGIDFSQKGNYQEALITFGKAVALDPAMVDAYYNIGSIYEFLGNKDKALEAYEAVLQKNPKDNDVAYKMASICKQKGDYTKAISYLHLVPADSPKYKDSLNLYKEIVQILADKQNSITDTGSLNSKNYSVAVVKGFQGPTGITKDSKDILYIANFTDNSIIQVTPDGQKKVIFKDKPLNGPIGLAVDLFDNIYIANYLGNSIMKVSHTNKSITTLPIKVNKPYYLYMDNESGILYISEQDTDSLLKVKVF